MLALSVSISTSSSPRFTSSPTDFSHCRIVPSSIESERRGMTTSTAKRSALYVADRRDRGLYDVLLVRHRRLLERLRVRHRHVRAGDPLDRRIEVVEGLFLHERGEVGADAAVRPALFDDHAPVRLAHRLQDRVEIER